MTVIRVTRDPHICDFCSSPDPVTAYQCDDFEWEKQSFLPHHSEGAWSACAVCASLIDAGRWKELTDRSFETFCRRHRVAFLHQPELRRTMSHLHELFRQYMHRPV